MKSWNKATTARLSLATLLLIAAGASPSWGAGAVNTKVETGCHAALTKAVGKHTAAVATAMATCANGVAGGYEASIARVCSVDLVTVCSNNTDCSPSNGICNLPLCPDATAQEAIDTSAEKITKTVNKKCQSACSVSGVPCIGNSFCPPNGILLENCTAGDPDLSFQAIPTSTSAGLSFPGPFCEGILGHSLLSPEDFGSCVGGFGTPDPNAGGLGRVISNELLDNIYGELATTPSPAAQVCLAEIVASASKTIGKLANTVAKCRNGQLGAAVATILLSNCPVEEKTKKKLDKTVQKFVDGLADPSVCTDATIAELSICGNPVGDPASDTVAEAQDCLGDMLTDVAYSVLPSEERLYAGTSIINVAYPATTFPRCGDNLINQKANQFALNGEECDGDEDSACPGECFPPGDAFECTCPETRRAHGYAYGFLADLDNGWTGKSHNAVVTDGAGFVTDIANCDCDAFDPVDKGTCIGTSSDPICDVTAETKPRCQRRLGDHTSCDDVGDHNGQHTDTDCRACDDFALNANAYCTGSARYCVDGGSDGVRCNDDTDCTGGACTGTGQCIEDGGDFAGNGCSPSEGCSVCTGGSNPGAHCSPGSCLGGGTCTAHTCATSSCIGGTNEGGPCTSVAQCPGAGARCAATSDCSSICYDANNDPVAPQKLCAAQTDCDTAAGERCRGACAVDTCLRIRNGAPLPLSSNGTSVCIDSQFFTNITGTRNIKTGEHAVNYELRSVLLLAGNHELNSRPCPVCGGFCDGDVDKDSFRCEGTCTGPDLRCRFGQNIGVTCTTNTDCGGDLCAGVACRFDDECSPGTCSPENSPECADHGGGFCRLDLACGGSTTPGKACRIEADTAFGTTSADCQSSGSNISDNGLAISWTPLTSEPVALESPAACDESGFQNYDCNCVTGGSATHNRPNGCDPACTDPSPSYYGRACSDFTRCVGGGAGIHGDGRACDENSDCTSNDCSGNPKVCGTGSTGTCSVRRCSGGDNNGKLCSNTVTGNDQCPNGTCPLAPDCTVGGGAPLGACAEGTCIPDTCVTSATCDMSATCDNACPAGLCVPLCVPRGRCTAGDRVDQYCGLDEDCPGGGSCVPTDKGRCVGGYKIGRVCDVNADCTGGGYCADAPIEAEEGACAQGEFRHCDGPGWEFKTCTPLDVNTGKDCGAGEDGIFESDGNADNGDEAADNNVGAGYCRADINNCFITDGAAEGGDTYNGRGDATNTLSVATFCIPASNYSAVNSTAGLPGPGRIRQPGLVVPNFTELP